MENIVVSKLTLFDTERKGQEAPALDGDGRNDDVNV